MDSSLLSKIENGDRIPTKEQLAALAKYFRVPVGPLEAQRLAETMRKQYGDGPEVAAAAAILSEGAGEYHVKKRPATANNRRNAVNNSRKAK